jgi:hypothetical protein
MRWVRLLLCAGLLGTAPALAQWGSDAKEVVVQVGKTVRIDVFQAAGLNCDDLDLVDAKLVTSKDKKKNTLVITGKAPGSTYCRAGQAALGYTVLVHIIVEERE